MMITYYVNESLTFEEYRDFLRRADLGSQYPLERFEERIKTLLQNRSVAITARNQANLLVGACFGLTDFAYFLFLTDLGVDRDYERRGIGQALVQRIQQEAGGENDISVITLSHENVVDFYKKCNYRPDSSLLWKPCKVWTSFNVT